MLLSVFFGVSFRLFFEQQQSEREATESRTNVAMEMVNAIHEREPNFQMSSAKIRREKKNNIEILCAHFVRIYTKSIGDLMSRKNSRTIHTPTNIDSWRAFDCSSSLLVCVSVFDAIRMCWWMYMHELYDSVCEKKNRFSLFFAYLCHLNWIINFGRFLYLFSRCCFSLDHHSLPFFFKKKVIQWAQTWCLFSLQSGKKAMT